MKKHSRALWLLMLALAVMGLSSCSMVFDAGVAGTVTDDKGENGLPYVNVYLYMSEEDWKADKATYDNAHPDKWEATRFNQKTATNANGTFAFDKIVWKTASSDFGKEADQSQVWLIYHSDKYGLEAQKVNMTSESRNTATPMEMSDKTESFNYRISFKDAADTSEDAASRYTLTYTYSGKPGEKDEAYSDDIVVDGSALVIPVTYYKGSAVPSVKLSNIVCTVTEKKDGSTSPVWKLASGQTAEFKASEGQKLEESFTLKFDRLETETFTYRVNFRNAGNMEKTAPGEYSFKYSYTGRPDTEGTWTSETMTLAPGSSYVEIPVTYYKGSSVPSIKLIDVKCEDTKTKGEDEVARWRLIDKANANAPISEISFAATSADKTEKTVYMPMQEMWWQIPGFSGEVVTSAGEPAKKATVAVYKDSEDPNNLLVTRDARKTFDNGVHTSTIFTGLASDHVIWRTNDTEIKELTGTFILKVTGSGTGSSTVDVRSTDPDAMAHIVIEVTP